MELMTWNDTLAAAAKVWASKCEWNHSFPPLGPQDNTPYGQNLYSSTNINTDLVHGVQAWYDEKYGYDYDTLVCSIKPCGHYTQVVWATSRQVGCAYYNCKGIEGLSSAYSDSLLLVCNYLPFGNINGTKPFKKGAACSKCASGAGWCKNGLCNSACSTAGKDCSCAAHCYNCAKLDNSTCRCSCDKGWRGTDCSVRCEDHKNCNPKPNERGYLPGWCNHRTQGSSTRRLCPAMCKLCTPDPDAVADKCEPIRGPGAYAYSTASATFFMIQQLMVVMMIILSINNNAAL